MDAATTGGDGVDVQLDDAAPRVKLLQLAAAGDTRSPLVRQLYQWLLDEAAATG